MKKKICNLIERYGDSKFLGLSYDDVTKKLIRDLISLKDEPQWFEVVFKLLNGLNDLLDREIEKATKLPKPKTIIEDIKKGLSGMQIFDESDIIKIEEVNPNRRFWEKVGYKIPEQYKIGESEERNYTHEGYKEIE